MRVLLVEGQPGSGKSTFSKSIYEALKHRNMLYVFNDEEKQDNEIFTDFWSNSEMDSKAAIQLFLTAWGRYISQNTGSDTIHIFDNSLMNHIQFLMALNTPLSEIQAFFSSAVELFTGLDASMVFIDGDSEVVINRVDAVRTNGWGLRVASLLETYPYQQKRGRVGKRGMIEFFKDAQSTKKCLLRHWPCPLLRLDVTLGDWASYQNTVLAFVKDLN